MTKEKTRNIDRELFETAKKYIPGGVNSPVRSFKAVGGSPVFVKRAKGSRLYAENGGCFIDYCLSWGALMMGHAYPRVIKGLERVIKRGTSYGAVTKAETELAKLIVEAVPSIDRVRLTNSGTEAVMGAVRLARGHTKKNAIIKFEGAYHGHADYLLDEAGSGMATLGRSASSGVPEDFTRYTISLPYNDLKKVESMVEKLNGKIAAIIVEPVAANSGVIIPEAEFLRGLRKIADKFNIVLIFDEVITGFRLSYGGAQEFFDVKPDLTCLGKIIGGGLPIGAFGGKKEIMRLLAPEGSVYQAGTLSGNPVAVTSGISTLKELKKVNPYAILEKRKEKLCSGIKSSAEKRGIKLEINSIGSMFSIFFTDRKVKNFSTAKTQDTDLFKEFFHGLLKEGVYFSPSGFEANFLSTFHKDAEINKTLEAVERTFKAM
ncbi:MAG: glutamate-1-semialdehyde 2,1-aminomutase [Candidatus Omnitrophica bacterium]|nr:glutamate-1-semialdehyde 2,1-aminomutase [Candidatus Omnitrophota bacterium]MBU1128071.1 glutamate-1-semialdehyde 2,1-aminomutase [Candidatus Omnitrophota bacterium]MBU1785107.1 glutamate-1-semialdehyde 2,1-aminomutase [Candidatus Omnitrophota bacterium]MBU1851070.1 glutamate-1-semialdehyde 2,1-aminomutase [Candidatus Omnitrophota bacterium]